MNFFQTSHVFENYASGLRYILFRSFGKDKQEWRGHYGPKMTNAYVNLEVVYCRKYNVPTYTLIFIICCYICYSVMLNWRK